MNKTCVDRNRNGRATAPMATLLLATTILAGLPGVRLSAAQAELDDYTRLGTVSVSAQLSGAAGDMLGYVNRSPVAGFTGQALAQARARHMPLGQWRPVEAALHGTHGLAGKPLHTRQIGHGRLVLVGKSSAEQTRRD